MSQKPSLRPDASESSLEDDDLVKKAKSGDQQSFTRLTEKYERALHFHILKMVKRSANVEDLVQEVFEKAFKNLERYNPKYAFSTWLYRIATNHAIDFLRKKKLQTLSIDQPMGRGDEESTLQLPDKNRHTDEPLISSQRRQMVQQAIADLPEKYRAVIELRHMQEKSYQEIADVLDAPLGTIKAHIYRAREMLYKALKDKRKQF